MPKTNLLQHFYSYLKSLLVSYKKIYSSDKLRFYSITFVIVGVFLLMSTGLTTVLGSTTKELSDKGENSIEKPSETQYDPLDYTEIKSGANNSTNNNANDENRSQNSNSGSLYDDQADQNQISGFNLSIKVSDRMYVAGEVDVQIPTSLPSQDGIMIYWSTTPNVPFKWTKFGSPYSTTPREVVM